MLDKNSDVSRMLDRMISKALVLKRICPKDKRAFDVLITDAGLELLKLIDRQLDEHEHFSSVSEEEATHLSDLLDKYRNGH
jgi:DNA-binding MarR family transcriptional regulator